MLIYRNQNYANNRLANTIVRYEGKPVRVKQIGGGAVICTKLEDGEEIVGVYEKLDITPVPLGYVNSGKNSVYLARTPKRQDWKQGLRAENLRFLLFDKMMLEDIEEQPVPVEDAVPGPLPDARDVVVERREVDGVMMVFTHRLGWHREDQMVNNRQPAPIPKAPALLARMPRDKDLANTIKGIYPTWDGCVKALKNVNSIAYDRNFAVDKDGFIYHKGTYQIGKVVGDWVKRRIDLFDKYWWTREALEESLS